MALPSHHSSFLVWAAAGVMVIIAGLTWWTFALNIDLSLAWKGWSVLDWMNHERMPENFIRDFKGGISAYSKSAFLHVYPLAERWLGIDPERMLKVVPALELIAVALAACALARALASRDRAVVAAVLFMYIVASFGADLDLARFGMPYSYTLYYYMAEALRLAAVALAIQRRYALSALLLAAGAVTHPTMSLYAGLFIIAMMLVTPRDLLSRGAISGAALFCVVVIPWASMQLLFDPAVSGTGEQVPLEQWLEIMHAFNYHFFPVPLGVFAQADARFLPLLSLAALWCHYVTRADLPADRLPRLQAGMAALTICAVIGVALSVWTPSPMLAKLSPHRASLLAVLVALPVVVGGLWRDINGNSFARSAIAGGALVAPFLMDPGWPLLFTAVLCFPSWWSVVTGKGASIMDRLCTLILSVTVLLTAYYVAVDLVSWRSVFIRTNDAIGYAVVAFAFVSLATARFAGLRATRPFAALAMLLASGCIWLSSQATPEERLRLFADYKAAQLWARTQTAPQSLFMVDPSHHYGWRDFSQRSSFGNLHEWLHTSWVYTSDAETFREGYARFLEFGVELAPYLHNRPSVARGHEALTPVIGERFNQADDAWRLAMARKYGIDYFVIKKANWKAQTAFAVVYENASIMILETPPSRAAN